MADISVEICVLQIYQFVSRLIIKNSSPSVGLNMVSGLVIETLFIKNISIHIFFAFL